MNIVEIACTLIIIGGMVFLCALLALATIHAAYFILSFGDYLFRALITPRGRRQKLGYCVICSLKAAYQELKYDKAMRMSRLGGCL